MSCILYYSKHCQVCDKYLQLLSRSEMQKDIHFICIDRRVKDENNKTYIILENGQKIILPDNVNRVPALLLLNQGYQVIFGEKILEYLKPQQKVEVKQATQNNMEPMAFSLSGGGRFSDIMSDQYSFLDQSPDEMETKGNGGMRQMHNYMDINSAYSGNIQPDPNQQDSNFNTTIRGSNKIGEDASNQVMEDRIKKMKEEREADLRTITGNRPPMSF